MISSYVWYNDFINSSKQKVMLVQPSTDLLCLQTPATSAAQTIKNMNS